MKVHDSFACFLALFVASSLALGQQTVQDKSDAPAAQQAESTDEFQSEDASETDRPATPSEELDQGFQKAQEDRRLEEGAESASEAIVDDEGAKGSNRAALGVMLADGHHGVCIRSVYANSPASIAGLRTGDRIDTVNGQRYMSAHELTYAIRKMRVGDDLTFHVWRNGQLVELSAKLGDRGRVFGQMAGNYPLQPHIAYRMPIESNQGLADMEARMMKLEDQVAELRELVRDLQSRLERSKAPGDIPVTAQEPEKPGVGLTDGTIELDEP